MDFGTSSDPLLRFAFFAGIGTLVVSLMGVFGLVILRIRLVMGQKREKRFSARWQPLFAQCVESVPENLPVPARGDHETFLRLWNYYHESVRGDAQSNLKRLAINVGMDVVARSMAREGFLRRRLLGVITLGNIRDRAMQQELRALIDDPSPLVSLAAAHALLRIDPAVTLVWLLPLAGARPDWPIARLSSMLGEFGADRVTLPLKIALEAAASTPEAADRVPRLLKLAAKAHSESIQPVVRRLLERTQEDSVTAACLASLSDPRDVEWARKGAIHPQWFVRVAAAKALGRIAVPEDRKLLIHLLADPHWWVRYRAGTALVGLPFVSVEDLRKIRAVLPDRFAAQMLDQVIAERS